MKIGLFLSESGGLISKTIDLEVVAKKFNYLSAVSVYKDFYTPANTVDMINQIRNKKLDAVVLAGESWSYYQKTLNGKFLIKRIESEGIDPNRISFANLKEQIALPHRSDSKSATEKAILMIKVELERVKKLPSVELIEVTPRPSVAILGTTAGAFISAQLLLEQGFRVHLLNLEGKNQYLDEDREKLVPTISYVETHPGFKKYDKAKIEDLTGFSGNFNLEVETDEVKKVLPVGGIIVAVTDNTELARELHFILPIDLDENGHLATLNNDTLKVQTRDEAVVVVPKSDDLTTTVACANAAAFAISNILNKRTINHELFVSRVNEEICGGCGTCVKTCIFNASAIDIAKHLSVIDYERCRGCGNCVTSCPTGARDLKNYTKEFLLSSIDILSKFKANGNPKILYFACEGCGYPALDNAAFEDINYPASFLPLRVKCGGRIDTQLILESFRKGFDGVVVCVCKEGHCRNIVGNIDLGRRANLFREILRSRGIDPERLLILGVSPCEGSTCINKTTEHFANLK